MASVSVSPMGADELPAEELEAELPDPYWPSPAALDDCIDELELGTVFPADGVAAGELQAAIASTTTALPASTRMRDAVVVGSGRPITRGARWGSAARMRAE
ncbi:hypothetical protein [Aestuariimicrobium sp. T2.26MG-19.2B]|uniref:hypothetical protein n=1 Tax=Aestuariimicrobium sp. T2.26MG-19.2B TaxID=3040679 RepID=UPI00253FFAA2|nr:hypothetical protein [Aestuariimicrobium sp. T2.26MG-19.2B]